MRTVSPVLAVAHFSLTRLLRSRRTSLAFGSFLVLHGVGWGFALDSDRLFGYAYLTALAVSLPGTLHADRDLGFLEFLRTNLSAPTPLAGGELLARVLFMALLGAWAAFVSLGLSLGNLEFALWYSGLFTIVSLILLPGVVILDLVAGTRMPVAVLYLLVMASAAGMAMAGGDPEWLGKALGLPEAPGPPGHLLAPATRIPPALLITWAVLRQGMVSASPRRRSRLPSAPPYPSSLR